VYLFKKIIGKINNETKINDVKIKEIETKLSKYNIKSNN